MVCCLLVASGAGSSVGAEWFYCCRCLTDVVPLHKGYKSRLTDSRSAARLRRENRLVKLTLYRCSKLSDVACLIIINVIQYVCF